MRWALLLLLAAGCGDVDETSDAPCVPPRRMVGARCLEPGVADSGCPAGTTPLDDGACQPAGMAPDHCLEGFVHDGDIRCEPVLPAAPCTFGTMAVPGETRCRPVMSCGSGKWGDIPIDASTQHVDASYAGGSSDGSAAMPWTSIGEAVAAADSGATIAIAAGSYAENVELLKPLRLWGVCPDQVEIAGTSPGGSLAILSGASGSEVHGLALTGQVRGLGISGALDVILDRLWIHDTGFRGIEVNPSVGPTSVTLRRSLVEQARSLGVHLSGSLALVEESVVRATRPDVDQTAGRGINVQPACPVGQCDPEARANVTVRRSVVEDNHDLGIYIAGSDAQIEATVVRRTMPQLSDQQFGGGLAVQTVCELADGCDPTTGSIVTVVGSVIEDNHDVGLSVMGSTAYIEATSVRRTQPVPADLHGGLGINVQPPCVDDLCAPDALTSLTLIFSVVEQHHEGGVVILLADALVSSSVVRDILPRAADGALGSGLAVQMSCFAGFCDASKSARLTIEGSVVEQSHFVGVMALSSELIVDSTRIASVLAEAGTNQFGDGMTVVSDLAEGSAVVTDSRIEQVARAGISSFGSTVALGNAAIACTAFDLEGEKLSGKSFLFEDRQGNGCGCPSPLGTCLVATTGLAVPPAIE